eukprot:TRINITY_DN13448_c0_g1_i1.p1 TRINITY_DN13448_c0_g1~~TRINITY_DN13448_c0_g1_i1.p1  ORF type:complete len:196 (-),score=41.21 TRINITY_DN13448_c0_g1_i1:766-1353(-)
MDAGNTSEDPPDLKKEAWLDRQTYFFGRWQKKWVVLDGQQLTWYANPAKRQQGTLDVDRCSIETEEHGRSGSVFKVIPRRGRATKFRADGLQARAAWIDIIKQSADQTHLLLNNWAKEDECVNCVALAALDDSKTEDGSPAPADSKAEDENEDAGPDDSSLGQIQIKDTSGTLIALKDVVGKYQFTVIALLRHFG